MTTPTRASEMENLRSAVRFHADRNDKIRKRAEDAEAKVRELRAEVARLRAERLEAHP